MELWFYTCRKGKNTFLSGYVLGKEYQIDFEKFPKGIRVLAVYIRDEELKEALRYES